ncbi:MAG: carbohydrate ABC transporter substrate-binding protein [Clostridium sp.]|nr:carbohydrate ABC transporter substrate-binding protein [Clostridium sp.]
MKKIKNIFSIVLIVMFISINIIGCSSKDSKVNNDVVVKEQAITVPEELYKIFKIVKQDDERLAVLGKDEKNNLLYFTVDSNFNLWEKRDLNLPEDIKNNNKIILDANLNDKGNLVLQYFDINNENKELILFDIKNLEFNNLNLGYEFNKIYINENGDLILYCDDQAKAIYYDIENNSIVREYDDIMVTNIDLLNDKLIISDNDTEEIISYDLESGDCIESMEILNEYNNYIIFSEKDSNDIYFKCDEGMYKYDNNEVELLFNIDNTQLCNTNVVNNDFVVLNDNTILSYGDSKDNGRSKIYKYSYGNISLDNMEYKDNNEEFVIYSLYENDTIRNYVLNFKDNYPNTSIKYRYGISMDNDVIETDAIATLNTELMAGQGPDVLFLDNLDIDNYYEKGILENITDIVNNNESSLFTNIIDSYRRDDILYCVPTSFNVPIIIGENVSNINDLDTLISRLKENIGNVEILINIASGDDIINTLYESVSINILNDDKTLNIEAIENILNKLKSIYDLTVNNLLIYQEEIINDNKEYTNDFVSLYLLHKDAKINICSINSYNQYLFMSAIQDKYNCDYTFWNGENGSYFRGVNVVGVNSNSKNKNIAKEFVNSLLNGSYYNTEFSNLSINKEVFRDTLEQMKNSDSGVAAMDENGEGDILKSITMTDDYVEDIINSIYLLNKAVNVNKIVLEKIKDEMVSYIEGKSDIDSTLNMIKNNLEIYLSE